MSQTGLFQQPELVSPVVTRLAVQAAVVGGVHVRGFGGLGRLGVAADFNLGKCSQGRPGKCGLYFSTRSPYPGNTTQTGESMFECVARASQRDTVVA